MKKQRCNIILVLSLFLFSCSANKNTAQQTKDIAKPQKYLALGDSYTVGELVEKEMSFPYLLVENFNQKGHSFDEPKVIATTGWRTDELLEAMAKEKGEYDLVSVLIGVNNQYQGIELSVFREEVKIILERAIQYSKNGKEGVFAYSIPDYSVMPFMRGKDIEKVASEINVYNEYFQEACQSMGIKFYNITPLSRMAAKDTELIADDKLHPSGKMYRLWVEKTVQDIRTHHLK